jgi:hypothetical protein
MKYLLLLVVLLAGCDGGASTVVNPPPVVQPPPPLPSPPGMATVQWTPPITNTDGSALTDLTKYLLFYGTDPTNFTNFTNVINVPAGLTIYVIEPLSSGTWYFELKAVNSHGIQSVATDPVSKVIQ